MSAVVSASSRRYAEAAFAVARDAGGYQPWLDALDAVTRALEHADARIALTSPAVPAAEKESVLEALVPSLPPLVRNFLSILVTRDRLRQVSEIATAFREKLNEEQGGVAAEVTTAVPLDSELQKVVAHRLGAYLGRDPRLVTLHTRVDPAIIGGVVARVGDTLIDDSVRGRITRLRRVLATSA